MADAIMTTWQRTGELRWFPRSMMQAGDYVLHEAWQCRENGRIRWEKVKIATPDEINAKRRDEMETA
jgi:hypothetical protein